MIPKGVKKIVVTFSKVQRIKLPLPDSRVKNSLERLPTPKPSSHWSALTINSTANTFHQLSFTSSQLRLRLGVAFRPSTKTTGTTSA